MTRRGVIALLLVSAACATAPPQTTPEGGRAAAPSPTPVAPDGSKVPTPVATPVPTVPPPAEMPLHDVDPPLVRVLLDRSSKGVVFPQPGRPYRVYIDGGARWIWGPLEVGVASSGTRWWQVGAWAEPASAAVALEKLELALGSVADVIGEPTAAGLQRVRVRWPTDEPEDPAAVLAALGYDGAFPTAGAWLVRIDGANGGVVEEDDEIVLEGGGDWPIAVGSRRYRGRFRIRAVAGEALVINELNIESYLRGVVPAEMGPSQFPQLDALKAQTVAARTYAVAHLGDHDDEGWDLCANPACQVYHGVGVEHRLTDRAVAETAGLVAVYEGEPIDAMYTSTCGGHTENSSVLFSGRAQPYLQGVVCAWDRPIALTGIRPTGKWVGSTAFAADVATEILGGEPGTSSRDVVRLVGEQTGIQAEISEPGNTDAFATALLAAAGVPSGPGVGSAVGGLDRLLFLTDLYGFALDPPTQADLDNWWAAAALAALQLRGEVTVDVGEAVPRPAGAGIFPRRAEHGEDLPSAVPLWERWQNGFRSLASAEVLPGTELERFRKGEEVVALVVRLSGGSGEADRRSAWREWIREKSWTELEQGLGMPDLVELVVTKRSLSGRVVGLAAVGRSGRREEWSGFDVRRALGLPETLFDMHLRTGPDGGRVVRFLGRGWGHGVGLCQNGSYGLARSGRTFDQILAHYYSGIELVRWQKQSDNPQSGKQR